MSQPKILVATSDKYLWVLRGYAHLLNKYWQPNPTVIVGGFTRPTFKLPKNFHFHTIGNFEDYPVDRWSDAMLKFAAEQPGEVFVLMLEDYWITRPVDTHAVQVMWDYMRQFSYVVRMDLTSDRKYAQGSKPYAQAGDVPLIISDPQSQYHMSLMTAIWRKEHFFKILVHGETPWEVELQGTPRLREYGDKLLVLGSDDPPLNHTLALRGGDSSRLLLDELRTEDVAELDKLGYLEKI